ncbi:dihydrolipoyl dehydrogenase [bacterium]|nr:dihydrolipoyl dehydrogenase [bacterium]
MDTYDVTVIGAGPGGYVAAIRAAQRGAKVALIERESLGGTCLNWGCIPTKAMIASAEVLRHIRHAASFGITLDGAETAVADWPAIVARKNGIVKKLRQGVASLLKANGVTVIEGTASFKTRNELRVATAGGETPVKTKKTIIASGSESARPSFIPFDDRKIVESKAFLDIDTLPASIIIIGGGVIGCEFASMLNAFGVEVTVVEMLERLLPIEDKEVSAAITRSFEKAGIAVKTGVKAENISATPSGVTCEIAGTAIQAEMMLVAVGRALNTSGLGLEQIGVKTEKGVVIVDERMQTTAGGVFAIGDITGKAQLAHVASSQAMAAADNATGGDVKMNYAVVPNCIFTLPEIASVGLNEDKAREKAGAISVGRFPYAALGKALAIGEPEGFYKIVADAETDEILGVQIVGAHATDLIAEAAMAIELESTATSFGQTIHAHPTLAEGLMEAAHAVHGECIHAAPRKK